MHLSLNRGQINDLETNGVGKLLIFIKQMCKIEYIALLKKASEVSA